LEKGDPMVRITAAEAKERFGELIRDVSEGREAILIEKDGEPQAVVISLDEYSRLKEETPESEGQDWRARLDRFQERFAKNLDRGTLPPAEEVIRRMREERDEQILGSLR
jgi:prevent-host-death family protein